MFPVTKAVPVDTEIKLSVKTEPPLLQLPRTKNVSFRPQKCAKTLQKGCVDRRPLVKMVKNRPKSAYGGQFPVGTTLLPTGAR